MNSFRIVSVIALLFLVQSSFAQKSYYTIFQGGGQFGINNPGYDGAFGGYHMHFVFGRNFDERAFLGFGLGNETFRGDYTPKEQNLVGAPESYEYDTYMFPLFIDARLPVSYMGYSSRIGVLANAGYAPKIGPIYDKGFLLKAGLFYLYETEKRTNYTLSASYGYQGLSRNNHNLNQGFQNQSINISVGIMLK